MCIYKCLCVCGERGIISFCRLRLLLGSHLGLRLSFLCISWHFFSPLCPSDFHHVSFVSFLWALSLLLLLQLVFSYCLFFDLLLCSDSAEHNLAQANHIAVIKLRVLSFWKQGRCTCEQVGPALWANNDSGHLNYQETQLSDNQFPLKSEIFLQITNNFS